MATVQELQTDAQVYATTLGDQIETLVTELRGLSAITLAAEPTVTWAGHAFFDPLNTKFAELMAKIPEDLDREPITVEAPTFPGDIQAIESPVDLDVPDFESVAPTLEIPAVPTLQFDTAPQAVPAEAITLPDAPDYSIIPAIPDLPDISIPESPRVDLPTFAGVAPENTLEPPSNAFAFSETPYASTLLNSIDEALWSDIENGGFGIHTDDEAMLLDRASEREREEGARLVDQVATDYASRRFDLPPGALLEAQSRARQAVHDAANTLNREIMLKRFDKFTEARQFAIQQGISVENMRMSFHGAQMERLLNAARYMADAAIAYYNVQVETLKVSQAQYEAEARVYEIMIRAKGLELDQYKTALEGQKLKGDLNRMQVDIYRGKLEGVKSLVDIFVARMRGAELQQGIERAKVETFRAQVDAYVAGIKAQEAKFSAFEAAVRGQDARVKVFEAEARAYESQLRGVEAKASIAKTKLQSQVERAKGQIAVYEGELSAFKADFDAQVTQRKLDFDLKRTNIDVFRAQSAAVSDSVKVAIANFEVNKDDFLGVLRHNLEKARYLLQLGESNRNWKGDITAKAASYYAPLASSALSAINTLGVLSSEV